MHAPKSIHMEVIDRILRYLKKNREGNTHEGKVILMIYVAKLMQIRSKSSIENLQSTIVYLYAET
jgi:hypothetical protein